MAVDYDLVVIGEGSAALCAAVAAAQLQARVVLVAQQPLKGNAHLPNKALFEVGRVVHGMSSAAQSKIYQHAEVVLEGVSARYQPAMQWAKAVVSTLAEQHSPAVLAALGVELIFGLGQFQNQPPLCFCVNERRLQARAYLIATDGHTVKPDIEGLQAGAYTTCEDVLSRLNSTSLSQWPEELIVIGGEPVGVELAQTFSRLGSCVTLLVEGPRILAKEDPEAACLIQACLEAEGIRILTHSRVTQVQQNNGRQRVSVGKQVIEASEILLNLEQRPQVEFLNLPTVGVKQDPQGIWVNDKLQTSNPRIFACGEVLGGYSLAHVARYEAQIALKNALFLPIFKVNYRAIPWVIFSDPELARVGLTEAQARRFYGSKIQVLKQFYKTVDQAQLQGETTGFCKLIVQGNGTILGAHLVGPAAGETIHAIALAIKHQLKVTALSDLVHVSPTLSEINFKTATAWANLAQHPAQENLLETFFNLRRSWSS